MKTLKKALAVWAVLAASPALPAEFNAPAPGRDQIEADWLRQDAKRLARPAGSRKISPEADAAGGVDGVKDGKWGFHTENEKDPWWQVDLGQATALQRVVIYNRCDGYAERNSRIRVLVSDDGRQFRQVYQHNGTVFQGWTDQKPLMVDLQGTAARFVRLALQGTSYFHLDEVEVYPAGATNNVARGKAATQSSTSEWSVAHGPPAGPAPREYPLATVVERGLKLAESQRRLGADVARQVEALHQAARAWQALPAGSSNEARRQLYVRARWAVRELALANPLLRFDTVLFVKRAPGMFPHMSDQHYGWWSRGGGGIYRLEDFKSDQPSVRCLTAAFPEGNFAGPDLSWDGRRVLFAYCRYHPSLQDEKNKADKARVPEDAFYHLYEMNVDGTGLRQITHGKYDDFDPRYLPNGEIAFVSTRKGQAIQCTQWFSDATRAADQPNSYVRCGGDNYRPVPVFTLHALDATGHNLRPLSAFENFEWTPSVANDGRLLYTRWDYIDRFNGHFFSLWSANQDGGNPQLVYKNYTIKPQVALEARAIPGSTKLVFTASAHHSNTGGSLCLFDRPWGTELEQPLTRLTPEVCFPETEGWPEHYYANPWPLSEEYFLVGWADAKLPPHTFVKDQRNPGNAMGIYLYDAFGNLELLYRDPDISSMHPIALAPRPTPPVHSAVADWQGAQEGRFLVQDVYRGLEPVRRGSIKQLRIVGVPPKVQPHMNSPVLGVSAEDPGKYVLGTVPVEADGSAYFRVPSGVPVFFQALDAEGLAVQTMRSLTYTVPAQTLSCVGCHEHRDGAPSAGRTVLAAARPPSKLTPGPSGSWPLRFDQLVQPVLDQHCVECHRPGGRVAEAARLDFTATNAWKGLMSFGGEDLKKQAFERDRSVVGQGTAANSKLWRHLTQPGGHQKLTLTAEERDRLATWMDTYAQRVGHYSDEQETQLKTFRTAMRDLLDEPSPLGP
jgi:hypothetical protein